MFRRRQKRKRNATWLARLAVPAALIGLAMLLRRRKLGRPWRESMAGGETGGRDLETQTPLPAAGEMASAVTRPEPTTTSGKSPAELGGRDRLEVEPTRLDAADLEDEDVAREQEEMPVTGTAPTAERMEPVKAAGEADDLKRIEGIGPAISRLLNDAGITTFRELADTSINRLDDILKRANLRRLADPSTWPEQARLAAEGDWAGLERFQSTLRAGRRVEG